MKFSKIAVAALFAAGFVTVPTTLVMADTREQDDQMVVQCLNEYTEEEGYNCIDTTPEEGVAYTTGEGDVDVKPIDSCWQTEDGVDVCARGGMVPTPATGEELPGVPVDTSECFVGSEGEDQGWMACSESTEEGEGVAYLEDMPEDRSLIMQNGVAKSAAQPDQTASNTLAAFGVLVAALGALGIGISRQKEAK
jgi:hypothetical protein